MSAASPGPSLDIRYEPNERPPHLLSLGLGFQYALLVLAGTVLTPAIVIRAANQSEAYLSGIYERTSSKTSSDTRRLHCLNLLIRFPRPFIAPWARVASKSKRDDSS